MTTLQAYDRCLWEAMRPECLQDLVVDPEAFVGGIEDLVVIHADQVPVWLSTGIMRQLYGNAEIKRRKKHEVHVPNLSEACQQAIRSEAPDGFFGAVEAPAAGAQAEPPVISEEPDGMMQTRQMGKGEADRFRVTVELLSLIHI